MSVKTRAQLTTEASTNLADNTTRAISAQDVRDMVTNIVDSDFNKSTDTADDINSGTSKSILSAKQGTVSGNILGDARGANATDFQLVRSADTQVASGARSFIAGGQNNKVDQVDSFAIGENAEVTGITARGLTAFSSQSTGKFTKAHGWTSSAEGSYSVVDGLISHVEGNVSVCSANDSHAEGNRTVTGRRRFTISSSGVDTDGDVGTKAYVIINDSWGDVSSWFPNALTDNIESRYGVGTQTDGNGNIYAASLSIPADLVFAMHPIMMIKGVAESNLDYFDILKATYLGSGNGTKVYYDSATQAYSGSIQSVYSSYSPQIFAAGNGSHAEGVFTSAVGYGAHAEGYETNALYQGAHAEGELTKAYNNSAHAEGYNTQATGLYSHSEGLNSIASGQASHAGGTGTTASGESSVALNSGTVAIGIASTAIGRETTATADNSLAHGRYAVARNASCPTFATVRQSNSGDDQITRLTFSENFTGTGWHPVFLFENLQDDTVYSFETTILGYQKTANDGAIGDYFAYRVKGGFRRLSGTITVASDYKVELISHEITASAGGDGITTGVRITNPELFSGYLVFRFYGLVADTFRIQTHTFIQEMKVIAS